MNGTIELSPYINNMDETWMIESNCENIRIWSEFFGIKYGSDSLWIGNSQYTGNSQYIGHSKINQTMTNNTLIRFKSGIFSIGFKLIWICEHNKN